MKDKIRLGRLKWSVAKMIHVKCADIYITQSALKHIGIVHKTELESIGYSALNYVETIVRFFNQIRTGSDKSLLLVLYDKDLSHVAAINLEYFDDGAYWLVKTAQPRRKKEIEKKTILWQACPRSE